MGKHEFPPFLMVVERGRLVPATPYDAERLDTWSNGTRVNVTFVRDGGRVMERKWWAILNRAVKECATPWKTSAEASEAVKLAIGVVNLTKTVGGDFLAYPKSLTELQDPELDEAVLQMIDVVYHVTGVDPAEWKRQVAHIRDETQESSPVPHAADAVDDGHTIVDEGSGASSQAAAPDNSADEADTPEAGAQATESPVEVAEDQQQALAPDLITLNLMVECREKFLQMAIDPTVPEPGQRRANLELTKNAWKEALPQRLDFVKVCFETADKVIKGELQPDAAKRYLEALA